MSEVKKREISEETKEKYLQIAAKIIHRYGEYSERDYIKYVSHIVKGGMRDYICFDFGGKQSPSSICELNALIAGNRVCQDWPAEDLNPPKNMLTESERDDLYFNFEVFNSEGRDYEKGRSMFGDEMCISFAISEALRDLDKELAKD